MVNDGVARCCACRVRRYHFLLKRASRQQQRSDIGSCFEEPFRKQKRPNSKVRSTSSSSCFRPDTSCVMAYNMHRCSFALKTTCAETSNASSPSSRKSFQRRKQKRALTTSLTSPDPWISQCSLNGPPDRPLATSLLPCFVGGRSHSTVLKPGWATTSFAVSGMPAWSRFG